MMSNLANFALISYFLIELCTTVNAIVPLPLSDSIVLEGVAQAPAAESIKVGDRCTTDSDCVSGAFCDGDCICLLDHVDVDGFCWPKLNPGENGCHFDLQCSSTWPGTRCDSGICRCSAGQKVSRTKEGYVCHYAGQCPTNGVHSQLFDRGTRTPSRCHSYDSSTGQFLGCDDSPDLHDCIDGICCPSRGLVCIMPMVEGDGKGDKQREKRWFHNSHLHRCEEFEYSGRGGNANNFVSEEQCKTFCEMRCERGDPEMNNMQPIVCNTDTDCGQQYKCTKVGDHSMCCPRIEFICSEEGGVHSPVQPALPYSPGSGKLGVGSVTRWYWDSKTNICRIFKYLGQAGNFNSFITEFECYDYCAKALCKIGTPLKEGPAIIKCSSSHPCPDSHECSHNVCCPSARAICMQPRASGSRCPSSASSVTRYAYSAALGICQPFFFTGCQGNDNNFLSIDECQDLCQNIEAEPKCPHGRALRLKDDHFWRCGGANSDGACPINHECFFDGAVYGCCPTQGHICSMPRKMGKQCLGKSIIRWHFDPSAQKCKSFQFGGCDGNSNNFANRLECEEFCQTPDCPDGGTALVDTTGAQIQCNDNNMCPSTHKCTRLFQSSITKVCCPSRQWVCRENADVGETCGQPMRRYYYDAASHICLAFNYKGCGGNPNNNFATKAACYNYCQSASCAPSEIVYRTSNSDEPFDCSFKSCPRGYSCIQDIWNKERKVCCGAPNFGVCPSDQRPLLDPRTQQPRMCVPNQPSSCPNDFLCVYNDERNTFYCCGEAARVETCPDGARMVRFPTTGDPLGCNNDSQCPEFSSCHMPLVFRSGLCCRNLDKVCPPLFVYDEVASEKGECSPLNKTSCGETIQNVCLFSDKVGRFVCCRREERQISTVDRCPPGSLLDKHRIFCSVEKTCPPSHFCVKRDSDRVGICCRHPRLGRVNNKKKVLGIETIQQVTNSNTTSINTTTTISPVSVTIQPTYPKIIEPTTSVVIESKLELVKQAKEKKAKCPAGFSIFIDPVTNGAQQCSQRYPCPVPYQCLPVRSKDPSKRVCCKRDQLQNECPTGALPLSVDGRAFSCKERSCPKGYLCIRGECCPSEELSCTEPLYHGTVCPGFEQAKRFYYDADGNSCGTFTYRGCNPNANNFMSIDSCESACVKVKSEPESVEESEESGDDQEYEIKGEVEYDDDTHDDDKLQCPPPYLQSDETVRLCGASRKPCQSDEKCMRVSTLSICCKRPSLIAMKSFMRAVCGIGFNAIPGPRNEPISCDTDADCPTRGQCRNSPMLKARSICCISAIPLTISPLPYDDGTKRKRVCKKGEESQNCLPRLYPDEEGCITSDQCMGQSYCSDGKCQCKEKHVLYKRLCCEYWFCKQIEETLQSLVANL